MKKIEIIEMIPQYGKINKTYNEIVSGKGFSFEMQKNISNFYKQYADTQAFEEAIIKLMFEADETRYSVLLNSMKQEIENNISIYNANQLLFDNFDIQHICQQYAERFDQGIKEQMNITREYNNDLIEANGSLETVAFRVHNQEEEKLLVGKYEECKQKYEQQKAKLDELYDMKKQATQEVIPHLENRCRDICELANNLIPILEKYFIGPKEKEKNEIDILIPATTPVNSNVYVTNQSFYFPMKLVSAIHEICNNEQFENITELDFYKNLNLHTCKNKLKPRQREKVRICYLIYLLSEYLPKKDRESWKAGILKLLEIDKDYYKSKYKEPVSDFPSDSNLEFSREIQNIF